MTKKDNLEKKNSEFELELTKKEEQINTYLDKIENLEVEIMNYEEIFDENAPKKKLKKALEEKLSLELNGKDQEIRELKDRMGFLRMEKIEIQKKLDLEIKKASSTSVIDVDEIREKEKSPLNSLLQELQDKINKQESIIRRLKSKDIGSDEFNKIMRGKDEKIEALTDQISDLKENLEKRPIQKKSTPKYDHSR